MGTPLARSRLALSSELVLRAVSCGVSRGDETTERLAFLLVQLALNGVASPGGLAAGLRVAAARLPDFRLDAPSGAADARLAALASVLVQSGVVLITAFDPALLPLTALADALASAGEAGEGPDGGASALAAVGRRVRASIGDGTPLTQLRHMYEALVTRYVTLGGAPLESTLDALVSSVGAVWSRHELARTLVVEFVRAGARMPRGRVVARVALADLLRELSSRAIVDGFLVAAAYEEALIELPDLPFDAPCSLGASIALAVVEGVLSRAWIFGKHTSLGGVPLDEAAKGSGSSGGGSVGGGVGGVGTGDVQMASPVAPAPLIELTPALGSLPGRGDALRALAFDALDLSEGGAASPSNPSSPASPADRHARPESGVALATAALQEAIKLLTIGVGSSGPVVVGEELRALIFAASPALDAAPPELATARVPILRARARALGVALASSGGDAATARTELSALASAWPADVGEGGAPDSALSPEVVVAALRTLVSHPSGLGSAVQVGALLAGLVSDHARALGFARAIEEEDAARDDIDGALTPQASNTASVLAGALKGARSAGANGLEHVTDNAGRFGEEILRRALSETT